MCLKRLRSYAASDRITVKNQLGNSRDGETPCGLHQGRSNPHPQALACMHARSGLVWLCPQASYADGQPFYLTLTGADNIMYVIISIWWCRSNHIYMTETIHS